MDGIPSFPDGGALRLLAMSATLSITAFVGAAAVLARRGDRGAARWACAPPLLALFSHALGRLAPALHPVATALTLAAAVRNALVFDGWPRALQILGIVAWLAALWAARSLFA